MNTRFTLFWLLTTATALAQYDTTPPSVKTNLNPSGEIIVTLRADQLILGSGSNAVTLTVTNGDTIYLPMKWLVPEVEAADAFTLNGDRITEWPTGGGSNTYGGIVASPLTALITTNNVNITGTNRLVLGTVASFESAVITGFTNVFNFAGGGIPPLPDFRIEVSTNGGTTWFVPEELIAATNLVSLYDANGATAGGNAASIVIYGYEDPSIIGNVLDLGGQTFRVDAPAGDRDVANLSTAQSEAALAAALWGTHSATARPNLAGYGLNFDGQWTARHISVSNETRMAWGPNGEALLTLIANHVTDTNLLGRLIVTNSIATSSNLTLWVDSKNVVAALVPQVVTNANSTNWADVVSYTSTWPLATNGVFKLTIPTSPQTNTFYRVRSSIQTNGQYRVERKLLVNGTITLNATNEPPVNTTTPTHWGLFSVDGMTNQFKVPLYQ